MTLVDDLKREYKLSVAKNLLTHADEQVARLTAENERLRQEVEHYNKSGIVEIAVRNVSVADYMAHWEDRAEKAEAEVERLRAALAFYADETNHVGEFVPAGEHDGVFRVAHHVSLVRADKGKRARAALEQP